MRIVLIQPHFAGERDALGGGHRGRALAQAAVEVGDRRAEHVHVGGIEQAAQRIVARLGRALVDRPKLEEIAVEEADQLAPRAGGAHRVGQLADGLCHAFLPEIGEIQQPPLR